MLMYLKRTRNKNKNLNKKKNSIGKQKAINIDKHKCFNYIWKK